MPTTRPSPSLVTIPARGRYRVDAEASTVTIHTKHLFGLGAVDATFALRSGEILVDDAHNRYSVAATVDAASFDSGNVGRDKRVCSPALLHTDAYPEINFVSRSVVDANGVWSVRGTLTVRGRSADFDLTVTETLERPGRLSIVATGTVDRYAHGITGAKGFAGRYIEVTVTAIASVIA
jgi:polyisoprenoid-binding protein YceI